MRNFLTNLVGQATKDAGKYKPVAHKRLEVGDVVLLKEKFTKAIDYPLGVVREIVVNDLDEVTGATVLKGKSKELVKRHVNSLVYLFSPHVDVLENKSSECDEKVAERPKRSAAATCRNKNTVLASQNMI